MEVDPELRLLSEGSGSARYWDARHRRLLTTHSFTEEDHAGAAGLVHGGCLLASAAEGLRFFAQALSWSLSTDDTPVNVSAKPLWMNAQLSRTRVRTQRDCIVITSMTKDENKSKDESTLLCTVEFFDSDDYGALSTRTITAQQPLVIVAGLLVLPKWLHRRVFASFTHPYTDMTMIPIGSSLEVPISLLSNQMPAAVLMTEQVIADMPLPSSCVAVADVPSSYESQTHATFLKGRLRFRLWYDIDNVQLLGAACVTTTVGKADDLIQALLVDCFGFALPVLTHGDPRHYGLSRMNINASMIMSQFDGAHQSSVSFGELLRVEITLSSTIVEKSSRSRTLCLRGVVSAWDTGKLLATAETAYVPLGGVDTFEDAGGASALNPKHLIENHAAKDSRSFADRLIMPLRRMRQEIQIKANL